MVEMFGKSFIGVEELAELLGYHRQSIYRLIKQKKLKVKKIFGRYYIDLLWVKKVLGVDIEHS